MWGKEKDTKKANRTSTKGVVVLIFLMLAIQFLYFTVSVIRSCRDRSGKEPPSAVRLPDPRRDSVRNVVAAGDRGSVRKVIPQAVTPVAEKARRETERTVRRTVETKVPKPPAEYEHDGWKWDRVELNSADSAALDGLPGIGPYYARKILQYRDRLWGAYAEVEQLLDITGIEAELLQRIGERIYVDTSFLRKFDLYSLSPDSLAMHPYIGSYIAKGIVRYRETVSENEFSLDALVENRILPENRARRLKLYVDR